MVICLERGADLHMAQLMPLPLTVSCFSKIQIGFTSLVLAHPGSPRKRAVKQVCVCQNGQKCVILLLPPLSHFLFPHTGTIADTDIINTPPELFWSTDVPFGGYKHETKDLGGIFGCKIDFWL